MAQYSHLNIYKSAYDFTLEVIQVTKNCPKEFKYSIMEKIQNLSMDMVLDVYRANSSVDKSLHLKHLLENVEMLNVYSRVCYDLKIINLEKYTQLIERLSNISKQTNGWLQACNRGAELE